STSGGSDRFSIDPGLGVPGAGGAELTNINGSPDAVGARVVTNTTSAQLDWDSETNSKKVLLKTTVGWMHQFEDTQANDRSRAGRAGASSRSSARWLAITCSRSAPRPISCSMQARAPTRARTRCARARAASRSATIEITAT